MVLSALTCLRNTVASLTRLIALMRLADSQPSFVSVCLLASGDDVQSLDALGLLTQGTLCADILRIGTHRTLSSYSKRVVIPSLGVRPVACNSPSLL